MQPAADIGSMVRLLSVFNVYEENPSAVMTEQPGRWRIDQRRGSGTIMSEAGLRDLEPCRSQGSPEDAKGSTGMVTRSRSRTAWTTGPRSIHRGVSASKGGSAPSTPPLTSTRTSVRIRGSGNFIGVWSWHAAEFSACQ